MHRKSLIIQIAPDKHVHKSCAIQIPTGKHSTGIVAHTNQEYICPGTDLGHEMDLRPVTMEASRKKLELRRYPPKDFCTARYERKSSKKKFQTLKKKRKKSFLGRSWAKIGLRKTQPMLVRSGEIPSPGQTSIDKTNDCAMKSGRGAPVRGSDHHLVHKTTGDRWRAPARRLIQTHLGAAV